MMAIFDIKIVGLLFINKTYDSRHTKTCFAPVFVTVPTHFSHTLREYASQGFRVLGLAYKHLAKDTDTSTVERSAVLFSVHRP